MKKRKIKKSAKLYRAGLSLSFIFIILVIFILNFSKNDGQVSVLENRNLKQKPEVTVSSIFKGNFSSDFEEYLSDQFIFRDFWIKYKAKIDMLFGKNQINDIYIGKDNYLLENFKKTSDEDMQAKTNAINNFVEKNENLDFTMMLVPTSAKILDQKLPEYSYIDDELSYIEEVKNSLNNQVKFIDLYNTLKFNDEENIYYKTDHHWTTKGAYLSYRAMCERLKMNYKKEDEYEVKTAANDFYGSLYYKLGAGIGKPDKIDIYIPKQEEKVVVDYVDEGRKVASLYDSESLNTKDKYEVFMGGNHSIVDIKSLVDNNKRLLVIKDSYANSMMSFLTQNYKEIVVVDLRYYNESIEDLINQYEISDVLFLYNVNTFNTDKSILNIEE